MTVDALKVFIRWCGSIDAVEQDFYEKFEVLMSQLDKTDEQSERGFDTEQDQGLLGCNMVARPATVVKTEISE